MSEVNLLLNPGASKKQAGSKASSHAHKEYDVVAEEATVQSIQSPIVKRDKSVDFVKNARTSSLKYQGHNNRIKMLEIELEELRIRNLEMLDEKFKIEKQLILYKNKAKTLEERVKECRVEKGEFEDLLKLSEMQGKKLQELNQKIWESNIKLQGVWESNENDKQENGRKLKIYEEAIEKLTKENLIYQCKISFKNDLCEKLQQELETLKSSPICESGVQKVHSNVFLSKHTTNSPQEHEFNQKTYTDLYNNYIDLSSFTTSLISLAKSKNLPALFNLIKRYSVPPIPEFPPAVSNLSGPSLLSFLQCQASVIEDYLSEMSGLSRLNLSVLSQ